MAAVALVHVDVMNAESGEEVEDFVPRLRLGAPALAEGVDRGILLLNSPLDKMLQLIAQIIVRTGHEDGSALMSRRLKRLARI